MIRTKQDAVDLIYASYNMSYKHAVRNQQAARKLLNELGSPDHGQAIVLVTGSKGKGSTASFISSLLQANGYKTGLFTSPHYFSFNERIRINGKPISDNDLIRLANHIELAVKKCMNELDENEYLGPIGITLAIALLYFQEQNVDYIILEAGKGGKFDDTNVVSNQWAVITPILREHLDELGPTISDIIKHKLGIVKPYSQAFIGKQQAYVSQEIEQLLSEHKQTYMYGKDFAVNEAALSRKGTTFHFQTAHSNYDNMFVPLLGVFQCENIALAVQACESILNKTLEKERIQQWLSTLQNPGKCEILHDEPTIILDAAINEQSAKYLHEIITHLKPKNMLLVIGLSNDKDYKGIIQTLLPNTNKIIITKPARGYKNFDKREIYCYSSHFLPTEIVSSIEEAITQVLQQQKHDLVFIVGNHSFIAEARQCILKQQ
jgi:dihydrofolate synthase/folylpolyglutamate synthase